MITRVPVAQDLSVSCRVDDYLWPWDRSTPVVMLHGFARNGDFWRRWIPYIGAEHRVYRPDVRGFGLSDPTPEEYRYATSDLLSDVLKVLDHFGIERAHFVGESGGGIFSVLFALEHPERVASIVTCDTPLRTPEAAKTTYTLDETSPGAAMRKLGVGEWCRRTLQYRLDVDRAPVELQEWYISEMGKTLPRVAATWNDFMYSSGPLGPEGLAPLLTRLSVPVLLLGGANSKIAGAGQAAFVGDIPNAELRTFPGYGHAINVLAPQMCAEAAIAFWAETESLASR